LPRVFPRGHSPLSPDFPFSNFDFRRKPFLSSTYTKITPNSPISSTYAKTGGYPPVENVGAPTFSITCSVHTRLRSGPTERIEPKSQVDNQSRGPARFMRYRVRIG
jgi:hypothetical protein